MLKATIFGGPRGPRLRQRRSELYCVGPKDVAQVGADQGLMESWGISPERWENLVNSQVVEGCPSGL
jgi:hypothetical protein